MPFVFVNAETDARSAGGEEYPWELLGGKFGLPL